MNIIANLAGSRGAGWRGKARWRLNEFRILFSYEHTALVYALRPGSRAARPRHRRGLSDVRLVVKPFRYALDPLCVGACALYAVNRFFIKPHVGYGFFHSHFND